MFSYLVFLFSLDLIEPAHSVFCKMHMVAEIRVYNFTVTVFHFHIIYIKTSCCIDNVSFGVYNVISSHGRISEHALPINYTIQ
jgi:hypothetical protein